MEGHSALLERVDLGRDSIDADNSVAELREERDVEESGGGWRASRLRRPPYKRQLQRSALVLRPGTTTQDTTTSDDPSAFRVGHAKKCRLFPNGRKYGVNWAGPQART